MKRIMICLTALLLAGNTYAFDKNMIDIHGFVSQGYLISTEHDFWYTNTEDGTFQFNEIGLNISAEPVENLRMGVQLLSRDLGEIGNNEVKIDWAYGDYCFRDWLGIRAGILKRPHGLYNRNRDIDAARTWIFLPTSVYREIYRDWFLRTQGIGVYGELPGDLSYEIQYGNVPVDIDSGVIKSANSNLQGSRIDSVSTGNVFAFGLRWDTPVSGLALAVSGFIMDDFEGKSEYVQMNLTRYDTYVASLEYVFENFSFAAEYMQNTMSMNMNDVIQMYDDNIAEDYYASAAYRFTDWFELGMGYSVSYVDKDDRDGKRYEQNGLPGAAAWLRDLSLVTRFDISRHWIFKLEGHYMDGLAGVTSDLRNDPSEDWFLFAAKMTFSF